MPFLSASRRLWRRYGRLREPYFRNLSRQIPASEPRAFGIHAGLGLALIAGLQAWATQ